MTRDLRRLLLVGGSRWARVYLSILAYIDVPLETVLVASRHGGTALAAALEKANQAGMRRFVQIPDWRDGTADAAIVVNAARDHASTASALLTHGVPVLVEKPAALTVADAEMMIAIARREKLVLRAALALNHCFYVNNFVAALRAGLGKLASITITWADPGAEARYGETKNFDIGTGLAEDVGPHIAVLLAAIGGPAVFADAVIARGGLSVRLRGACGGAALVVDMARQAAARRRVVSVCDADGRKAQLDFSVEPGTITLDGVARDADPGWSARPSPLTLQILDFLRLEPRASDPDGILSSTNFAASAAELVRMQQRRWLPQSGDAEYRLVAMRELLAPQVAATAAPGDTAALEDMAKRALAGDAALLRLAGLTP